MKLFIMKLYDTRIFTLCLFNHLFFLLLIFSLVLASSLQCRAQDDLSPFAYSTVKMTGQLKKDGDKWILDGRVSVDAKGFELSESAVEMVGVLYSVPKDRKPYFSALKIKNMKSGEFSIEKYDKPILMNGKKPRIIEQHPIAGNSRFIDYFDGPLGQIVIYFEDEKEYNVYRYLKELTEVTLEGTLTPAFAHPKGPGKDKVKQFFGFQMKVEKVKLTESGR